jgi:predicted phage terminase large subunit-like protein
MPKFKKKPAKKAKVKKLEPIHLEDFDEAEIDRILAEKSFHEFVKQAWHIIEPGQKFCDNWHIEGIAMHLQAVHEGKISQLLINVPPGTMKSLLANVFWPAWVWTKSPEKRFMFSSYAEELSMRDSVKCRNLILSEWYQDRWPTSISADQNTKGKFQNTKGGWRMVGSIGGRGLGEHPDYNFCDDPHKVKEAESEQERQNVIDWLDGTFSTRGVSRGVRKVLIMQRLHYSDASGHLLEKSGWVHICLPMRYEVPAMKQQPDGTMKLVARMNPTPLGWNDPRKKEGELLWPELYPEEVVNTLEINLGIYHSAGQLQQRPAPRGGGTFKRAWFEILQQPPALQEIVRYWDKSGVKGGSGAQTSGVLIGKYEDTTVTLKAMRTKFIVLDVITCRESAAEREAIIKQTAQTDKPKWGHVTTWVEQEPGSGGKESAEGTVGNLAGFSCKMERVTGSKEVRADPLASQASVGKVKILIGHWNQSFLDELEHFPVGKLKDQVDAAGGGFNKLNSATGAFESSSELLTTTGNEITKTPDIKFDELTFDNLDLD